MVLSDGPQPCLVLENLLVVCQDDLTAALAELDGMALSSSWDACTGLFFGVILGCLFGCFLFFCSVLLSFLSSHGALVGDHLQALGIPLWNSAQKDAWDSLWREQGFVK